jgi:hypothetical protein
MHKLYCDWVGLSVNDMAVVIAECHALIKPEDYISVIACDCRFKEYATCTYQT